MSTMETLNQGYDKYAGEDIEAVNVLELAKELAPYAKRLMMLCQKMIENSKI